MRCVVDAVTSDVPSMLVEIRRLGCTVEQRAGDVLVFVDHAGTSNGPTEAISGRLERLGGCVVGFRNRTNYIAPSLLKARAFRPDVRS